MLGPLADMYRTEKYVDEKSTSAKYKVYLTDF